MKKLAVCLFLAYAVLVIGGIVDEYLRPYKKIRMKKGW